MAEKIQKSDADWRRRLSAEEYAVTRRAATEPAFSGRYWNCHEDGTYRCVCCGAALFDAETKFDSGSGWPSFREPLAGERVTLERDLSHGMERVEVKCARCDAHLGHVFPDGPPPGGVRFCINSSALRLTPGADRAGE